MKVPVRLLVVFLLGFVVIGCQKEGGPQNPNGVEGEADYEGVGEEEAYKRFYAKIKDLEYRNSQARKDRIERLGY